MYTEEGLVALTISLLVSAEATLGATNNNKAHEATHPLNCNPHLTRS